MYASYCSLWPFLPVIALAACHPWCTIKLDNSGLFLFVVNSTSWPLWSRIAFCKWDGLFSIKAVVMYLADLEGFCIQCSLKESSLWHQIWHSLYVFLEFDLNCQQNSDPSDLIFWVTFQPKDTSLHQQLQIWRDISLTKGKAPIDWGVRRQSLETWEKYSNEKLTPGCLWAITCLWGKSQYAICTSSGNETLWNWAFCGVFSPEISMYHIGITAEETKALRL